jgi:hypothetical protein
VDELVAFIKARLDEDAEDFAVSIEHCPPTEIYTSDDTVALVPRGVEWYRRMLRGVDAKRRLLEFHQPFDAEGRTWCGHCGYPPDFAHPSADVDPWPCRHARLIASEWPTHEAYQEEWRV